MKIKHIFLYGILMTILFTGCENKIFTRSNIFLDTIVEITIYNGGSDKILDDCFNTIQKYDSLLNAFDPESQISQINTEFVQTDQDVYELIEKNAQFYNLSKNYFSPFLGNIIKLWDFGENNEKQIPDSKIVNEYLEDLNGVALEFNPEESSVRITQKDVLLNLGATAKGFVADRLKKQLVQEDVKSAIINLGGNILLIGNKDGKDFSVGIESPELDNNNAIGKLSLSDKSIVTSGYSQRYFLDENNNLYHHILDPLTGFPAISDLKEVVIVSNSSLVGDYLSTTCFVMGQEKATEFLETVELEDDIGYVLINKNDQIIVSENLKDSFSLLPEYEITYDTL